MAATSSILEAQHEYLTLLRDATAAGLISWRQAATDRDRFDSESDLVATYIQFRFPSYNDEDGSDRDYVRVSEYRFMIGTVGWRLTLEILAAGLPDWRDHLERILEHLGRENRRLSEALGRAVPPPGSTGSRGAGSS